MTIQKLSPKLKRVSKVLKVISETTKKLRDLPTSHTNENPFRINPSKKMDCFSIDNH
jgi:hypothetical protein